MVPLQRTVTQYGESSLFYFNFTYGLLATGLLATATTAFKFDHKDDNDDR
jgi:hypothetical protein